MADDNRIDEHQAMANGAYSCAFVEGPGSDAITDFDTAGGDAETGAGL
jgi:hypothetical protein